MRKILACGRFFFFIAADQPMEFNKCGTGTTKVFSFSGSGLSWRSGLKLQDDVQLYFPSQIWGIYLNPILTKNNLSELLQSPSVFKIKYPKIEYFIYSRNRIDNVRLKRQIIRLNIYLSMYNVWIWWASISCIVVANFQFYQNCQNIPFSLWKETF